MTNTPLPKKAVEAAIEAYRYQPVGSTWYEAMEHVIRAALPHLPGHAKPFDPTTSPGHTDLMVPPETIDLPLSYQEPIIKAVERILDECSAWVARPNEEVTERIALAAGIAVMTSMSERHDRVYETGFAAGQEAMRESVAMVFDDRAASAEANAKIFRHDAIVSARLLELAHYDRLRAAHIRVMPVQPVPDQHLDDLAVERFAGAMKAKLAKKRAEGRGGWYDKTDCSQKLLSDLLREHVAKGDPVDVANFAMMLHQRGETIKPAPSQWRPIETAPKDGTKFLAYQRDRGPDNYVCWWLDDFSNWTGWQDDFDAEPEPTHWTPLPAPPEAV